MPDRSLTILGITGSLRAGSSNTRLLESCRQFLPEGTRYSILGCGEMPFYESSLDGETKPPAVGAFRKAIEGADALLISTPEYNYSIPGSLKNGIDWASRPGFRSPLAHKPTGILSASTGVVGGARAQGHLKQILAATLSPVFPSVEFLVGEAGKKFDEDGKLTDEKTLGRLERYVRGFTAWAVRSIEGRG